MVVERQEATMGVEIMKNASMAGDDGVVDERRSPCWLNVESEGNRALIYARHRQPPERLRIWGTRFVRHTLALEQ